MNVDELLGVEKTPELNEKREQLISAAAGGSKFLMKGYTVEQIEKLSDIEIDKLYTICIKRTGAAISKQLGTEMLQLYTTCMSSILTILDPPKFINDLDNSPVLDIFINSLCGQLYHKLGIWLAPVIIGLITAKHSQVKEILINKIYGTDNGNDIRSENSNIDGTTGTTGNNGTRENIDGTTGN